MYYMYFCVFLNPAVMGYYHKWLKQGPKAWFLLKQLKKLLGQDSVVYSLLLQPTHTQIWCRDAAINRHRWSCTPRTCA